MFDFLRVAGFATLALAAAGAPGQMALINAPTVAAKTVVEALPPVPATIPLSDIAPVPAMADPIESIPTAPRASSLAALVRAHGSTVTGDRETECLAAATYFESKSEPLDGQLAVANVILNRTQSGRFASTVCGVVYQRGQFSFVRGGSMPPIARNSANWREAVAIAYIAQNDLWKAPAEHALFFHAKRVSPNWKMQRVGAIGNHIFYR
ncbi:MAG: cell wall hydrolase [Sphingomonadales bacterium]